ncbi:MAG: YveK family protein [Eubacterium sp.]
MNIDANLQKMLFALIRRWKLLIIALLIGGLLGYIYTANFTTLTYTSTVEFLAYAVDSQQELDDSTNTSSSNAEAVRTSNTSKMNYAMKMLNTYIEIMNTNEFHTKVAEDLNKRINANYTPSTIRGSISIELISDTAMFKISVTTTSADLSYEIAHQLEASVPEMMKETNNGLVLASVQDKAIKAASAGSLGYPKKIAIGAAAGLLLAAIYVILRNLLDIRVKTGEELIEKYNIPVLGSIPNFEVKNSQKGSTKRRS